MIAHHLVDGEPVRICVHVDGMGVLGQFTAHQARALALVLLQTGDELLVLADSITAPERLRDLPPPLPWTLQPAPGGVE